MIQTPKMAPQLAFLGMGALGKVSSLLSLEILNMGRLNFAHTANKQEPGT
jgi:hypothetical protein